MTLSKDTQRIIDAECLIVFPSVQILFCILALMGFAIGVNGQDYIATTHLVVAFLTIPFPYLHYKRKFLFPYWFIAVVTFCMYAYSISLFMGFFEIFWWWDEFTHWFSSIIVSMIVFFALCILTSAMKKVEMSNMVIVMMVFFAGFGFGGVWEIYEGSVDYLANKAFMSYSLTDTLYDIHMDVVGAFTMTVASALILRNKNAEQLVAEIDENDTIHRFIAKHQKR